jgi:dTDP-4-amino-4,6-dideoxygalactose transaminase
MARWLPPVYSPVTGPAIAAGARALARVSDGAAMIEARLREYFRAGAVLLTDSGTSALTLALRDVARTRPGAPVALPAYCCYDVATAADGAGVPVALYDVDPTTLGPDFATLRRVLAEGAAAVVVAHLYGIPVDVGAVEALAREHGALLIDDAAQGTGASCDGRPLGAAGSAGVLSFGRGKGVTGGGGGALLGNDAPGATMVVAARSALMPAGRGARRLASVAVQAMLGRPGLYGLPASIPFLHLGETLYRRPWPPASAPASCVAVLGVTWPLAGAEADVRRRHAARLVAALRGPQRAWAVRGAASGLPGYLRLPLVVSAAARARAAAARRLGIMPGYPRALIDLPGFGDRTTGVVRDFPGARLLTERLITLPTHRLLRDDDLVRLESWLASAPD